MLLLQRHPGGNAKASHGETPEVSVARCPRVEGEADRQRSQTKRRREGQDLDRAVSGVREGVEYPSNLLVLCVRSGTGASHSRDAQRGLHALYSRTNAPVYHDGLALLRPGALGRMSPRARTCVRALCRSPSSWSDKQLLSTLSVSVASRPEGRAGVHDQRSCTQPLNKSFEWSPC